ncbi:MAG: transcriptional regulator [Candidatus Cloacimonadota bacterium]|nr:MAG: transcriptional regulator [Candidatus Cloacimonadota bacterium]
MWGIQDEYICQSCGLLIEDDKFGPEPDGTYSEDYCQVCYEEGEFNEPTIRMEDMIERSARKMAEEMEISEEDALKKLEKLIPTLKRWKETW